MKWLIKELMMIFKKKMLNQQRKKKNYKKSKKKFKLQEMLRLKIKDNIDMKRKFKKNFLINNLQRIK